MKNRNLKSIVIVSVTFASVSIGLGGCSNREVYDSLQGAKQEECNKIADNSKRQNCFDDANKSYDRYRREQSAAPTK